MTPPLVDIRRLPPPADWGVTIDDDRLSEVAALWKSIEFSGPAFDYAGLPTISGEAWLDFCVVSVSVLACLWPPQGATTWETEFDGDWLGDAPGLFACFTRGGWRLDSMATMTDAEGRSFFAGRGTLQLVPERTQRLREVAGAVQQRWQGSVVNLVEEAGWDGPRAAEFMIDTVPGYVDRVVVEQGVLAFDKLAHLCVALMAERAPHPMANLATFPVYPDYMLPKYLRYLGIVSYSPELAAAVDTQQLIEPHTPWELAIRWATVHAAEVLRNRLNEAGNPVTSPQLDYHLWSSAVLGPEAEKMGEHHRTVTLAY